MAEPINMPDDGFRDFLAGPRAHASEGGLSLAQYREKWGLPKDYPSVSPAYSAARSAIARAVGLGQTGGEARVVKKAAPRGG